MSPLCWIYLRSQPLRINIRSPSRCLARHTPTPHRITEDITFSCKRLEGRNSNVNHLSWEREVVIDVFRPGIAGSSQFGIFLSGKLEGIRSVWMVVTLVYIFIIDGADIVQAETLVRITGIECGDIIKVWIGEVALYWRYKRS